MLKPLLIALFTLQIACGQMTVQIRDIQTQKPLAYVNIWKENSLYKTADSMGIFFVSEKDISHHFKLTCVGYQDTLVKLENQLLMQPDPMALAEVEIIKRKFGNVKKLGKAKRGDSFYAVQWDASMAMTAKYFPNLNTSNLFLSKVRLFALTSAKNRLLNVLVYSVNENGDPGEILNSESILCRLKKGSQKVEIDLDSHTIEFPSNGVFIVLQHPLLEQNKNYNPESTHPNAFFYEPTIAIDFTENYKDSWYFTKEFGLKVKPIRLLWNCKCRINLHLQIKLFRQVDVIVGILMSVDFDYQFISF